MTELGLCVPQRASHRLKQRDVSPPHGVPVEPGHAKHTAQSAFFMIGSTARFEISDRDKY